MIQRDPQSAPVRRARPIIFFDGRCPLCNRFVDLVIQRDREGVFLFAPLQGPTAGELLDPQTVRQARAEGAGTIVLRDEEGTHTRSAAVLRVLTRLGGVHRLWGLLGAVPPRLRDWAYDQVARNRDEWFGKLTACRRPSEADKARFLP
jgi:predicted DCC family thiol-disulfide oxidoreductase YuxK